MFLQNLTTNLSEARESFLLLTKGFYVVSFHHNLVVVSHIAFSNFVNINRYQLLRLSSELFEIHFYIR